MPNSGIYGTEHATAHIAYHLTCPRKKGGEILRFGVGRKQVDKTAAKG